MGILKRVFGICETKPPADGGSWSYAGGKLIVDLGRTPELAQRGGAVRLEGAALPARVLVVNGLDGQYHAFRNKCTHMGGRRIDPLSGESMIRCCSVGKSTFDYTGKRISGSATEALPVFAIEHSSGKLVIDMEQSCRPTTQRGD
jgi:nitrite reductase/ring-hydroxylating ferredoxin subunit